MLPVAEHAEALELLALDLEELLCVGAAAAADVELRQLAHLAAQLLGHLMLDRHAVAVPARHVRCLEPGHRLRLDDDVLDDLVERGAEVDMPVGVRRPVVQHVLRLAGVGAQQLLVAGRSRPSAHDRRLALRQVRAHREIGLRQIERVLVIHRV